MAEVRTATTLAEAVELLAADSSARPLAAGLGVLLRRALDGAGLGGGFGGAMPPSGRWVDVRALPELAGVQRLADGRLRVGAGVTIAELATAPAPAAPPASSAVSVAVPAILRAAAGVVANPGIRVAGTLGGNLVGSGTSSDVMAALAALGAVGLVEGSGGSRRVRVSSVPQLLGPGRSGGKPAGRAVLLRGVESPGAAVSGWGFERLTYQGAMDRAAATVAVVMTGPPVRVRIAATSVADRVVRFAGTERNIERRLAAEAAIEAGELEATAAADLAGVALRDDLRVSAWYRRAVLPVLVRRAVEAALAGRTAGGSS